MSELNMNRVLIVAGFFALCFSPYWARADTNQALASQAPVTSVSPPVPDVSGWNVVNTSRIGLGVSSEIVAYIGLMVEYSNPANPREFVRVIRRHNPLIISKRRKHDERLFVETIVLFYNQKEEQDRFNEVSNKSDPIVYIQWRTKENLRNYKDMQDGSFNIWLLRPDGNWTWVQNKKEVVELLSENIGSGKPYNIFSGMKYQIEGVYHIVRVDRNDLLQLFKVEE